MSLPRLDKIIQSDHTDSGLRPGRDSHDPYGDTDLIPVDPNWKRTVPEWMLINTPDGKKRCK